MSFGLQQGTIFAGRYQVLGCIAAGGMGAVYEVLHLETERRRALKVMLPHMIQSAELRDRFKREAKIAAKVDSEFIVDVFDAGVDEATQMPFLVMELLRGEELGKRLKRQGRFSPVEVVTYLQQTAMALDKTHQAAIVHRDLKPDNLFLTFREDGQPRIKVLDFGVAKVIAESGTATGGTRSLGTPIYMSPEQFNPEVRLTGAADIYALGMMAYTLLVGAPYWSIEARSGNVIAFAMSAVKGPPEAASTRAGRHGVQLPPAFDAWFANITAIDPSSRSRRFPTATGAVAALAEALGLPSPRASFSLEQGGIPRSEASQGGLRLTAAVTPGLSPGEVPTPVGSAAPMSAPGPMSAPASMSSPTSMSSRPPVISSMNMGSPTQMGLPAAVGSPTPIGGLTPAGAAITGQPPARARGATVAVAVLSVVVAIVAGSAFVLWRGSRVKAEAPLSSMATATATAAAAAAAADMAITTGSAGATEGARDPVVRAESPTSTAVAAAPAAPTAPEAAAGAPSAQQPASPGASASSRQVGKPGAPARPASGSKGDKPVNAAGTSPPRTPAAAAKPSEDDVFTGRK